MQLRSLEEVCRRLCEVQSFSISAVFALLARFRTSDSLRLIALTSDPVGSFYGANALELIICTYSYLSFVSFLVCF
jgi:hypothetical protein